MPKQSVCLICLSIAVLVGSLACAPRQETALRGSPVMPLPSVAVVPSLKPAVTVRPSVTATPSAVPIATSSPMPTATRILLSPTPAIGEMLGQGADHAKSAAVADAWVPAFVLTATPTSTPTPLPTPRLMATAVVSEMTAFPVPVGKALLVDQSLQVLRVYEDGLEVRVLPVSTGLRKSYTPAFNGRVGRYLERMYGYGAFADHAWYLTKAYGNIYIHGAPYTLEGEQKLYEGLDMLGVAPASHGCIRLHPDDAVWLFEWDPRGVPILVTAPDFVKFDS